MFCHTHEASPQHSDCNDSVYAEGILLDCKAFYIVFCKLEECCRVPHGDPVAMQKYADEYLAGKRPFLTPALVTNGILAAELALKFLMKIENQSFDRIHFIDQLFDALPEPHKSVLINELKEKAHQSDATLQINLTQIKNHFQDWRYFYEKDAIGYTGFMTDFIHIVCDYAFGIGKERIANFSED